MDEKQILQLGQGESAPYPRNQSVVDVFEEVVLQYSNRIALAFQDKILTYQELNSKANQMARFLRKKGVEKGDFVGVGLEKSLELFVGILGVLKAGAAYVPMDPFYPDERKTFMLNDAKISVLLTSSTMQKKFSHKGETVLLDQLGFAEYQKENLDLLIKPLDVAYLNYTSGTTGKPKGVLLLHRGINRYVVKPHWLDISPEDRFLQICNISFDGLTQELWGALLNGASLWIYPEIHFSPKELGAFLIKNCITQAVLTARLFNLMVEESLSSLDSLRYLGVAGDVMSVKHTKIALKKLKNCRLMNEYGPTENTTCTTVYHVKAKDDFSQGIPIGKPIGNTFLLLLDEHLKLVPFGSPGELCVGGDGLAKGYLHRPDITEQKFISNPYGRGKLYRTGDLARYLPDGNLLFLGRMDTQVKIRGFRVELSEIEEVIRSHPLVADCAVVLKEGEEKKLIAWVEFHEKVSRDMQEIQKFALAQLPEFMIPHFFCPVQKLPLTENGKVDRTSLSKREIQEEIRTIPKTPFQKKVARIWREILQRKEIFLEDHFFQIGGDSIAAMQLASLVHTQFGVEPSVQAIIGLPTFREYAQYLEKKWKNPTEVFFQKPFTQIRQKEAILDPSISAKGLKTVQTKAPKHIFLTGATGFVGAFFLHTLLKKTKANIHCLVQCSSEKEGKKRLKETLETYLLWDPAFQKRILVCKGSLEEKKLGFLDKDFEKLGKKIEAIFHFGAFVNHALAYEQHKKANVLGTEEIIRLAATGTLKPLHLISSLAILEGIHPMPIGEDVSIDKSDDLLNGYVQSKWVAEKLAFIAMERNIPVSIYRLPRVSGDSKSGAGPTSDFLWRLVQASILLKMAPKIDGSDDLTPVDSICKAIYWIAKEPKCLQNAFHVVTPHRFIYKTLFSYLRKRGYTLAWTDFSTWQKTLLEKATQENDAQLQALSALFMESKHWDSPLQHLRFSCKKTVKVLKKYGFKYPKIDDRLCKKYIDYYVKTGFIPKI